MLDMDRYDDELEEESEESSSSSLSSSDSSLSSSASWSGDGRNVRGVALTQPDNNILGFSIASISILSVIVWLVYQASGIWTCLAVILLVTAIRFLDVVRCHLREK